MNIEASAPLLTKHSTSEYIKVIQDVSQEYGITINLIDVGEHVPPLQNTNHDPLEQLMMEYLNGPTISDPFGNNHEQRRAFIEIIQVRCSNTRRWIDTNRLRFNHIFALQLLILYSSNSYLIAHPELAVYFDGLVRQLPQSEPEYACMNLDQKIRLSLKIAEVFTSMYHTCRHS